MNHKKIKRLMREHAMHPPRRRRFVATTDSNHDEPVFPDRSREREVDGPNQLWVADLTYIAILGGFVYPTQKKPPPKPLPKRFFATVAVDPEKAGLEVARIMDGLLVELTRSKGSELKLTLELDGASAEEGFRTMWWRSSRPTPATSS